jgi:hypothetical protein
VDISERLERWVKVSIGLGRFEPFMMPLIQSLGRLDVQLCIKDAEVARAFAIRSNNINDPDFLADHITLSYLWVLGAYEAVRTLTQRARDIPDEAPPEVFSRLKETRSRFARLRVPLAKMEPAAAHKETDSHIAYPALSTQHGIAWQLNETLFVSRKELSDLLLHTLEFARAAKLAQQASPSNHSLQGTPASGRP